MPYFSVTIANLCVMLSDKSFLVLKRLSQNKQRVAGIKTKTVKNAQDTPIVIIMPKSITGLILLVTKDKNATIVVSIV